MHTTFPAIDVYGRRLYDNRAQHTHTHFLALWPPCTVVWCGALLVGAPGHLFSSPACLPPACVWLPLSAASPLPLQRWASGSGALCCTDLHCILWTVLCFSWVLWVVWTLGLVSEALSCFLQLWRPCHVG